LHYGALAILTDRLLLILTNVRRPFSSRAAFSRLPQPAAWFV
jgi:hypothetical protein